MSPVDVSAAVSPPITSALLGSIGAAAASWTGLGSRPAGVATRRTTTARRGWDTASNAADAFVGAGGVGAAVFMEDDDRITAPTITAQTRTTTATPAMRRRRLRADRR